MNTHLRTASLNDTPCVDLARASVLTLTLCLVVLTTAGCGDMAPPATSVNERPQPYVSAPGQTVHARPANFSRAEVDPPAMAQAAGADEFDLDYVSVSRGDQTRVVFLHGLHSPLGMALAMSRIPTPQ